MSITLRITFSGLCLFVPDERTGGRMHVLFPATGGTGRHAPHAAVLVFDTARRDKSGLKASSYECYDIRNGPPLEFRGSDGAPNLLIPPSVLDIGDAVDDELVNLGLSTRLDGRVILSSGAVSAVDADGCWQVEDIGAQPLAYRLTWAMEMPGVVVTLNLPATLAAPAPPPIPLHPEGRNKPIDIFIMHVTNNELPERCPKNDDPGPNPHKPSTPSAETSKFPSHIAAYGDLAKQRRMPDISANDGENCNERLLNIPICPSFERDKGASSLSCMIAAAYPVKPPTTDGG